MTLLYVFEGHFAHTRYKSAVPDTQLSVNYQRVSMNVATRMAPTIFFNDHAVAISCYCTKFDWTSKKWLCLFAFKGEGRETHIGLVTVYSLPFAASICYATSYLLLYRAPALSWQSDRLPALKSLQTAC